MHPTVTSRPSSRTSSPAPREGRGRAGRDESPRRPNLSRRDSSPMARMATLGLLATSTLGTALGAPVSSRDASPSRLPQPEPTQPHRQLSRLEQDMAEAMNLIRRNEDPYAGVDWSKVDYSKTDYSKVDWNKINYDRGDVRAFTPSAPGTPQAMPSPTLSSLGRAYEQTFGSPSPLATPPVPTSIVRGFSPGVPASVTAVPASNKPSAVPLLNVEPAQPQVPFKAPTTTTSAATPSATAASFVPPNAPGGNANINFFEGVDVGQNAVAVAWHGKGEMTFSFFQNSAPYQPALTEAFKSVTLQSGQHQTVQLPHGWSGRLQKMTGAIEAPATWSEFAFDQYLGNTWFDQSYIRGYNGPSLMYLSQTPDLKAGSSIDMLEQYPRSQQVPQPKGCAIPATEGYDGTTRFDIIDFWRAHSVKYAPNKGMPERLEAYIVNNDDEATMTGPDKHLIVEWF